MAALMWCRSAVRSPGFLFTVSVCGPPPVARFPGPEPVSRLPAFPLAAPLRSTVSATTSAVLFPLRHYYGNIRFFIACIDGFFSPSPRGPGRPPPMSLRSRQKAYLRRDPRTSPFAVRLVLPSTKVTPRHSEQ